MPKPNYIQDIQKLLKKLQVSEKEILSGPVNEEHMPRVWSSPPKRHITSNTSTPKRQVTSAASIRHVAYPLGGGITQHESDLRKIVEEFKL